uniref:Uncharacterized protein n=1 Tax=Arundo donax TaxID=35708 RepID=A0A0A8ZZX9_ARUDO
MAPLLVSFLLLLLLQFGPSSCANVYIVYMGERSPELNPALVRDSHHGMLAAVLGSYRYGFSGS